MNRLRDIRTSKDISQQELANKIGVTQRYIAFIEQNERTPSLGTAFKIANSLGVSIEEIFLSLKCTKSTQK